MDYPEQMTLQHLSAAEKEKVSEPRLPPTVITARSALLFASLEMLGSATEQATNQ